MHRIDPMNRERATVVLMDFRHTKLRFQENKIFWALPWVSILYLTIQLEHEQGEQVLHTLQPILCDSFNSRNNRLCFLLE